MAQVTGGNPKCMDCGLYRSAESVCLMGRGALPAKFMIITDSPGWAEDEQGKPLVGKGRDLLYGMLKEAGIDHNDCYFTNAVKCRPPDGRPPKSAETKACKKYLDMELAQVKPQYVLLLGAASFKLMLGSGKITEEHGKIIEKDGVKYMPSFSPWIAFRDPKRAEPLKADLNRFGQMLQGKFATFPELNLRVITNFDDFNAFLFEFHENEVISFDLETTDLVRFVGKINCIGFGMEDTQWILPLEHVSSPFRGKLAVQTQMMELIAEAFEGKKIITHNGKFDNLWVRHHFEVRFGCTFDTMMAAYALNENTPNGLKYLSKVYCNAPDYDIGKEEKKGETSSAKLYKYCGYDVYYTRMLYFIFRDLLRKDQATLKIFKFLLMPAFEAYENIEEQGTYINKKQFDVVEKDLKKKLELVSIKLQRFKRMNWGSTQQVAQYLFVELKLPIIEKTKTGGAGTGESILLRLQDKHPCIALLLEFRGVKQQISFFIDGWKRRMYMDDKLFPTFKLNVTATGRTSCDEPNIQQTPRDKVIRSLVGAPPGWTMVQADYSQVELRVVAMVSGEPTMKFIFQTNQDIHTKTAQSISGNDTPTKEQRKQAKPVNFGFVYGMGWKKFKDYARDKYGVILTDAEAKEFRRIFFDTYSILPHWHNKQRRMVRIQGYVRNPLGRLRRLPEIYSPDEQMQAEAERQAINSPVQSFASDITLMSLVEFDREFDYDILRTFGSVHDAILFIVRTEWVERMVPEIKRVMENPKLLSKVFGVTMPVPLVADVEVGDWGNGVSIEEWVEARKTKLKEKSRNR